MGSGGYLTLFSGRISRFPKKHLVEQLVGVCKRPRCERCALAYCSVDCSNRAFLSHEQRCRLVPRDAECVDDAAEATLCPTCDEELRKCWMCAMLGDPG